MKTASAKAKLILPALALAAALCLASAEAPALVAAKPMPPEAAKGSLESGVHFSLVDGDKKPVTEKSWPGKYQLVFFGFTHCPDICPVTLDKLSVALHKMGDETAAKVKVLFITTDPARDTPDVVKTYVENVNKSITGLTGTEAQVKAAEDVFKVYAVKNDADKNGDYSVDHSAFIYLMSPEGKMLEVIGAEAGANDIVDKVKGHL